MASIASTQSTQTLLIDYRLDTASGPVFNAMKNCDCPVKIIENISYGVWKTDLNKTCRYMLIDAQNMLIKYFKELEKVNAELGKAMKELKEHKKENPRLL